MTTTDFITRVLAIADSRPTYREGGTGADGTCDCIGLVMGALKRKYPIHSTNYYARYEMDRLAPLTDARQLLKGDLVYKAREDKGTLNARYLPGGRYYTGDLLDYYHVGVVTSTEPLIITHCTSTGNVDGITTDTSIRGWTHYGADAQVEYDTEEAIPTETTPAIVTAPNGKTVNMRKIPDQSGAVIKMVPIGQTVQIRTQAQGWAQIEHGGDIGYMMTQYLRTAEDPAQDDATVGEVVTITIPRSAADALLAALKGVGG